MTVQDEIDHSRKVAKAWVIGGVLVTLPALMLAAFSSGAGHGDYGFARVLFPVPMLLTFNHSVGLLSLISALLQFPIYGWIFGRAKSQSELRLVAVVLAVHCFATIACFSGLLPNFS